MCRFSGVRRGVLAGLAAGALALLAPSAGAQERPQGIVVTGRAEVAATPDTIELTGVIRGEAELANDAMVKYRDNKRRAIEALEKLGIAGLKVRGAGFHINSSAASQQMQMMMRGMPADAIASKVVISEGLTISLPVGTMGEEELMKTIIRIVDTGKDSGATIGGIDASQMVEMMQRGQYQSQPMAVFKLVSSDEVRNRAYEVAMKDARANAERLAALAGGKLGKVLSISDASPARSSKSSSRVVYNPYVGMAQQTGGDKPEYDSQVFGPIPVAVVLNVQFALQ